jgi:hypothetical protein
VTAASPQPFNPLSLLLGVNTYAPFNLLRIDEDWPLTRQKSLLDRLFDIPGTAEELVEASSDLLAEPAEVIHLP